MLSIANQLTTGTESVHSMLIPYVRCEITISTWKRPTETGGGSLKPFTGSDKFFCSLCFLLTCLLFHVSIRQFWSPIYRAVVLTIFLPVLTSLFRRHLKFTDWTNYRIKWENGSVSHVRAARPLETCQIYPDLKVFLIHAKVFFVER